MKTGIKILAACLAAQLIAVPCMAAPSYQYSFNDVNKTITLDVSGLNKYEQVTVELLKAESEVKDSYTKDDVLDGFIMLMQAPAKADGTYSFTASLDGEKSGDLTLRINGEEAERIYYATAEQKGVLLRDALQLCSGSISSAAEGLAELLKIGSPTEEASVALRMFGLTDKKELYYAVSDKDQLYRAFYTATQEKQWNLSGKTDAEIAAMPETEEGANLISADVSAFTDCLKTAGIIEGVNESLKTAVDYKEEFALDADYLASYDRLSPAAKSAFNDTYFKGKGYLTYGEIAEAFPPAVLHALCANFNSWGDVEYFITTYGEENGVDMTSYNSLSPANKSSLYTYALEQNYTSVAQFASVINAKAASLSTGTVLPPNGGGNGGGSFGGGGRGSGSGSFGTSGTSVTEPIKPDTQADTKVSFNDLKGSEWAEESIIYLAEEGIVNGNGDGGFEPERNVTREEMLAMLMRAYGIDPTEDGKTDFTDAQSGEWYCGYLAAAQANGLINGNGDGSFGVGADVTRQDAAVMAHRLASGAGDVFNPEVTDAFTDGDAISDYAAEAVYALKNAGILSGRENGAFAPLATCTRAEAAKIIYMLIKQ